MFPVAAAVPANSWHLITLQEGIQGVTVILFSDVTYEFIKQQQQKNQGSKEQLRA